MSSQHNTAPPTLDELGVRARLLGCLPAFLRHPISPEHARSAVAHRLHGRAAAFLAQARRSIYARRDSPYLWLLRVTGCEYGDLEQIVTQEGLEGALHALYARGVYLTVDEFKGRSPVVRGSQSTELRPAQLLNAQSAFHVPVTSGGSRGAALPIPTDLGFIAEYAMDTCLVLAARRGLDWPLALWAVPGGGTMNRVFEFVRCGARPVHWFSPLDPARRGLHWRYRWSGRVVHWATRLTATPLPMPRYVSLDDPLPVLNWLAAVLAAGKTPHLFTYAMPAVRLCRAALAAGLDLRGTQFMIGSEPLTATRLATMHQAGAEVWPRFGANECGPIGFGCLAPHAADDLHQLADIQAVIQPGADSRPSGPPPEALLISSLRPRAPVILVNVSLGDQATLVQRNCGCPLEAIGWTTHLHTVRRVDRFGTGNVMFRETDLIRALEVVLPARLGGGPGDYQLVEGQAEDGRRLRLLVHPSVGALDEGAVVATFLEAIGSAQWPEQLGAPLRRPEARCLVVERAAPRITLAGKFLHLHQERGKAADR